MQLFERSEFCIFRDKDYGMKAPDSLSGSKPLREFSCILLLRSKEVWEHHKDSDIVKQFQLNKTLNITIYTYDEPNFIFIYYNSRIKVKLYLYQGGL